MVDISQTQKRMPRAEDDPRVARRLAIIVFASLGVLVLIRLGASGRVYS